MPAFEPSRAGRSWRSGAAYWLRLVTAPSGYAAATTLFTLAGTSLLYRHLPEADAGHLALLLSLVDLLSMIAALGTPTLLTRLHGAPPSPDRDWLSDLAATVAIGLIPITVSFGAVLLVYQLPPIGLLYLAPALLIRTALQVAAALLNVAGRYAWAALLQRVPNASLFAAWLIGLFVSGGPSLSVPLITHLAASAAALAVALRLLVRSLPRGTVRTPLRQRLEGLTFLGSSLAMVMPDQGLVAIAGRLLAPAELAGFAAAAILLRPFRLLRSVLSGILMPEVIRRRQGSYRRHFAALGGFALGAGLISALIVPPLARWFYAGRYLEGIAVIPILAAAGAVHLMTALPKSDFSARAPAHQVHRYVLSLVLAVAAAAILGAVWIAGWGVAGLAAAVLLAELTEGAISLAFWLRFRRGEQPPD